MDLLQTQNQANTRGGRLGTVVYLCYNLLTDLLHDQHLITVHNRAVLTLALGTLTTTTHVEN